MTRTCLLAAFMVATGCGRWPMPVVSKQDEMYLRLGEGLPENTIGFEQSGLQRNAAYLWAAWTETKHYLHKPPGVSIRKMSFFRFWPSGHVAFSTATLGLGEEFGATHADDMEAAVVGRFVVPESGKVAIERFDPASHDRYYDILEGRITEDGDVIILRKKRRGDTVWGKVKMHGRRRAFEQPLQFVPDW